ncbi:hypothetical protein BJ912DRAFT_1066477 [Pholiota molesta]|nr:hypothetical protein BJ912DRAFT_1066477 [Pholiota molesta]
MARLHCPPPHLARSECAWVASRSLGWVVAGGGRAAQNPDHVWAGNLMGGTPSLPRPPSSHPPPPPLPPLARPPSRAHVCDCAPGFLCEVFVMGTGSGGAVCPARGIFTSADMRKTREPSTALNGFLGGGVSESAVLTKPNPPPPSPPAAEYPPEPVPTNQSTSTLRMAYTFARTPPQNASFTARYAPDPYFFVFTRHHFRLPCILVLLIGCSAAKFSPSRHPSRPQGQVGVPTPPRSDSLTPPTLVVTPCAAVAPAASLRGATTYLVLIHLSVWSRRFAVIASVARGMARDPG